MAEFLKEPCLIVGDINDIDIDLSMPPASGEEYIKRVVIEAQRCNDVVVAKIDEAKLKKPTIDVKMLAGRVDAPATLLPTPEWQNCQLADFSDVRLRMASSKLDRQHSSELKRTQASLPDYSDQTGWLNFCFGSANQQEPHAPSLDLVCAMNQPLIEQVLEYLVEEVERRGEVSSDLGQWLYALLVALELPLNPDICSSLRTLARACSRIRANLASTDQSVSTLNLFICLVARYFRQLDLADP